MAGTTSPAPIEALIERVAQLDEATAAAIERIVERAAVHDRHSPIGEHTFVRLQEGEHDTFGLVARFDDVLVAYAQATRYPDHPPLPSRLAAEILVDPPLRGRGLARALVDRLIAAAHDARVERLDVWAHHADAAAIGLAGAYGMVPSRQLWQMALRLDSVAPHHRAPPAADGVVLRRFRSGEDEPTLIGLIRQAFTEHPENAVFDAEAMAARASLPWFDPSAILLAEDAASGRTLGMHWMKIEPPVGEVYILAVAPEAHGRGIGRLLLLSGLQQMRERGIGVAILYVDAGNDAAIGLYRAAGFRFEHLDTCYSLTLASAAA
ncbi:MAG TPA: mycothiol synthase [Candidatus Limnocylindria bacterium]|nr:mycothiol synthase [Candidatus Limnocylindria bacterium]